eukprot:Partr_v1_DN28966_c1_g1_i1_m25842 putative tyrosylDNA phosphodiesterase
MVQMNYMLDVDFLLESIPDAESRACSILAIHGMRELDAVCEAKWRRAYPNVRLYKPPLPFEYGTHHTKAMILFYNDDKCRVVIHTANLIPADWSKKTQAAWVSPFLDKKSSESVSCSFEADLIDYLSHYGSIVSSLIRRLREFDFTPCKCDIVASVPGRHSGQNIGKYGHMKARKCLQSLNFPDSRGDSVVFQASSIGSLGISMNGWWGGEFLQSFGGQSNVASLPAIKLVFPTVSNVRDSLEGYAAGGSIPFDVKNYRKQSNYMLPVLHEWRAEHCRRSRAMPHIKTYCRFNNSFTELRWFILTSANLSKAAWGALEKKSSQLMIRNFELGVLLKPSNFGPNSSLVAVNQQLSTSDSIDIPVPYDIPLTRYKAGEDPWTWNSSFSEPDMYGERWNC